MSSGRFGWCDSGKHEDCIVQYHSLVTDAFRECSCPCHTDEPTPPRKKGW